MNEKLTSLAQLRMTAEKSKELSAQVASAMAEAVEELDASKAAVEHTHTAEQVGALPADETNKPYEFISSSGTKCTIYGGEVKFSSHDENSITLKANNSGLDYPMIEIYATISGKEYRVGFLGCYGEGTGHLFLGSQYSDSGLVVTRRYVDDAIAAALTTVETALAGV